MIKVKAVYNFISHMSKREKIVFYATVFFVTLTLLDRLVINPISSKMQSLDKEIALRESEIKKSTHILAQKDRISVETAKYTPYTGSDKTEEEEVTSLLKEIESIADKSLVYLIDMKPAGVKEVSGAKKYLVNLNCEAQMEQITVFMYAIESSSKLLVIEKYQIGPKSKDSSIGRCSIIISKLVIP